jgi:outer membrane receptor for ferrienterochelin and colicins
MSLFRVRRSILSTLLALVVLPSASLTAQTGMISGRVTDAASGQPIENAQVQAQMTGGQSYGAISGADGQFRVVNLPDGSYTVTVRAIGYDQRSFPNQRPGSTITAALTERPTQLNQTVVTATRTIPEKQLDAPAMISVVTSERIAERASITVADHLRSTPGVDISKGGLAQSNIVSRGFNNAFSGSMLMLQDYRFAGVPSLRVNVPFLFTGTNEDIDRIEVLLGPASALYGPNSSNGVLHIITKSPFNSQGTTISVDGGERSVLRTGLRHAGKVSDRLAYKLSGEYFQGRDWEYKDLAEPALFPTTSNVPEARRGTGNQRDFDLERYTGEARIDIRPTTNTEAITTLGYTKIGNGIELTGFGTSQIRNWSYANIQQRFRWNRLFLQAFLNSSNAGNDTSTSTTGTVYLRSGESIVDKSRVAALQAQHGFDLGTKQSFTYGADYIWTNPRTGNTINGGNENVDNVTEYGAYIQSTTRPIPQLELLLAARGDANNVIEGQFFSPRAAIIIKPSENQNIRFTFNRAFSTPANFSFFLDLLSSPNIGGSGFDLRGRGNPPKTGFTFRRDCASGATGSLCMKSPYAGQGDFVGASAAAALPGFFSGRRTALTGAITPGITGALQQAGLSAAQAQALGATLAAGAIQRLATTAPAGTDIATRISYLTAPTVPVTGEQLADITPLTASYNNTYEVGYKGIVGNRFRFDVAFWGQERGDVGIPAALATPSVFFGNPQQLGGYIGSQIGQYLVPALIQNGFTQAQATTLAGQLAPALAAGLTPTVAAAPLGVVTFNDPNTSPTALYATYQASGKKIWVRGIDLATDVVATDRLTFELVYSYQDRTLFPGVNPAGAAPFVSNSPGSRGSLGGRYRNESNGVGFELRGRYNEGYAVNSTVYGTNIATSIAAGNPGATNAAGAGFNRCNPAPAGNFCYENVQEAFLVDAQLSKNFTIGTQQLLWSLNATNLFDNRVRTFAAVPEIGRLILTRLQYTF